jgi:hypothetical protein
LVFIVKSPDIFYNIVVFDENASNLCYQTEQNGMLKVNGRRNPVSSAVATLIISISNGRFRF